jgi:hypothetical protein
MSLEFNEMNLSQEVKPYKKVDGIYSEEESKWQKFWYKLGSFFVRGVAGHWQVDFKIKF